jgi:biopolymer transport protein ExbB
MSNGNSSNGGFKSVFALVVIPVLIIIAILIYVFLLGSPNNFDADGRPANYFGTVYEGGFIVPILIAINLIVITFAIERFITISKAKGRGNVEPFVRKVKALIAEGHLDEAIAECDRQRGSIAAVVRAGLTKYKFVENDTTMDKEGKIASIQKELEEATSLELPMLSKNLVIISTCASIATLVGLIGTVLGMIRAFAALAQAGAPDATALATGISEALINTALGIIGSCIAIILYNYFTTRIDSLTYGIDEAGFSIVQTFNTRHKAVQYQA